MFRRIMFGLGVASAIISFVVGLLLMFTAENVVTVQWGVGLLLLIHAPDFIEGR